MRFSCAMLYVKDLPRMREFYSELLGTKPVNTRWTDDWARFQVGETSFALHAIPPHIAREIQASDVPRENAPAKFIFEVDDVAGERRRMESLKIRMLQRPWQDPAESFEAVDPEGNIFQVSVRIQDQI